MGVSFRLCGLPGHLPPNYPASRTAHLFNLSIPAVRLVSPEPVPKRSKFFRTEIPNVLFQLFKSGHVKNLDEMAMGIL
jgi:hypothetical protein